ncbi:hypothetical protein GGR56DRAFT_434995 [Xylariaceae sp. FL0804]|nr:hypothetical protein GGR56DRAFT_434995 [Xylariaceae sp. FL0804]
MSNIVRTLLVLATHTHTLFAQPLAVLASQAEETETPRRSSVLAIRLELPSQQLWRAVTLPSAEGKSQEVIEYREPSSQLRNCRRPRELPTQPGAEDNNPDESGLAADV